MKRFTPLCLLVMALCLQSLAVTNCKINATSNFNNPVCTAHNGSINIRPTNGSAPYSYRWGNGSSATSLHNLIAGNYAVTITDAQGCTVSQTFALVTSSRVINLTTASGNDTCAMARGRMAATVQGNGNAPFKYVWSNGATTASINGLGAHYYSVVVTDSNGCTATAGAGISNTGSAITISGAVTSPVCYNGSGAITAIATGGYGTGYNYLWNNGSVSSNISNLQAGNYTLAVTGQHGCSATHAFTVTRPDSIQLQYTVMNLRCDQALGGSITSTNITGANYPWTANWTGPNGYVAHSVSINGLSRGIYRLAFTDVHGCSTSKSYTVDSIGAISMVYNQANIQCGGNTGAINYVSLSPYSHQAAYMWSGPSGFSSSAQSVSGLAAGNYALTVAGNYGCRGLANFTITRGFDVGVAAIKNYNVPTPGRWFMFHPVAGDMSQLTGNRCAAGVGGKIQFSFTGQAHYAGVTPGALAPDTVRGDTLIWNIADFGAIRTDSSFFVLFNTDSTAGLFTQVCATVTVTPLNGDYNPANNTMQYCLSVVRPNDPNQMEVLPTGNIETNQKLLTYTVHFQNTGNAPAQNVYIIDTLDSHLDISTFKMMSSSHQLQTTLTGNLVKFDFANINLPDKGTDEAGSHGSVQYTVKWQDGLAPGTEIKGNANIYFDFNQPVPTNYVANTIVSAINTGIEENGQDNGMLTLSPNPAHRNVSLKTDNDAVGGMVEVVDALGRKCVSLSVSAATFQLPLTSLAAGVYMIYVIKPNGLYMAKKLIVE